MSKKGQEMKVQVNATFTLIGTSKFSDDAKKAVLNPPKGKQRWLEVSFTDDAGNTVTFKVNPRLSKTGSITGRLTDKAVGCLVTEDAAPSKGEVKAASKEAERKSLEQQLLHLDD